MNWNHDPGTYGTPRQSWKNWQKILWLMFVAQSHEGGSDLSAPVIAATFNKHYRQAGLLNRNGMPRDLGALKQKVPSLVGDHADKSPITWFLTDEGIKEAKKLVAEAKGEPVVS